MLRRQMSNNRTPDRFRVTHSRQKSVIGGEAHREFAGAGDHVTVGHVARPSQTNRLNASAFGVAQGERSVQRRPLTVLPESRGKLAMEEG
jgi:hypothetical protein